MTIYLQSPRGTKAAGGWPMNYTQDGVYDGYQCHLHARRIAVCRGRGGIIVFF